MPDTAGQYLYKKRGYVVTLLGEALRLQQCQAIKSYQIYWNQTYNGTCYHSFPVTTKKLVGLRFLDFHQRRLVRDGRERPCTAKAPPTYVKDKKDQLWHLEEGKFAKVSKMNWLTNNDHIGLTKIGHFQSHLIHYEKPFPQRLSMLGMLGRSKEVFDELHTFQTAGHGSILAGIGSLLGQTIHSLASGSSQIIKAL